MRDVDGAMRVDLAIKGWPEGTVRCFGSVDDELLWQCYAAADVLVFPLIRVDGDVEGFATVVIEAAVCGTPTVAFSLMLWRRVSMVVWFRGGAILRSLTPLSRPSRAIQRRAVNAGRMQMISAGQSISGN